MVWPASISRSARLPSSTGCRPERKALAKKPSTRPSRRRSKSRRMLNGDGFSLVVGRTGPDYIGRLAASFPGPPCTNSTGIVFESMSKRPPGKTKQAPDDAPLTKAERRDAARRERQELVRRAAIRRKRRRLVTIIGVIVLVAGIAVGIVLAASGGGGSKTPAKQTPPGLLTTDAPWPANSAQALTRANHNRLPSGGGATLHPPGL